jgi:hypothetical protein
VYDACFRVENYVGRLPVGKVVFSWFSVKFKRASLLLVLDSRTLKIEYLDLNHDYRLPSHRTRCTTTLTTSKKDLSLKLYLVSRNLATEHLIVHLVANTNPNPKTHPFR